MKRFRLFELDIFKGPAAPYPCVECPPKSGETTIKEPDGSL